MKQIYLIVIILFVNICGHPFKCYGQISIKIDSMVLISANDYPERIKDARSDNLIVEASMGGISFEHILTYGPHVHLHGRLINDSDSDSIIDIFYLDRKNTFFKKVLAMYYEVVFEFHDKNYLQRFHSGVFDITGDCINDQTIKTDNGELLVSYLPAHSEADISAFIPFLYKSKWDKLNRGTSFKDNIPHNLKVSLRMEKVARKILPTLSVNPIVLSP